MLFIFSLAAITALFDTSALVYCDEDSVLKQTKPKRLRTKWQRNPKD